MRTHDVVYVSAHIPDTDGTHYVVDQDGELPTSAFSHQDHTTYEGTLDAITKRVIGMPAKIDRRLPEIEQGLNSVVYRTKSVGSEAIASGYGWKALDK